MRVVPFPGGREREKTRPTDNPKEIKEIRKREARKVVIKIGK